jgi:hypothetical protein
VDFIGGFARITAMPKIETMAVIRAVLAMMAVWRILYSPVREDDSARAVVVPDPGRKRGSRVAVSLEGNVSLGKTALCFRAQRSESAAGGESKR